MASTPSKDYKRREREQKKFEKRMAREAARDEKVAAKQAAEDEAAAKEAAATNVILLSRLLLLVPTMSAVD